MKYVFFDRDLSWLSFNARVLEEAQRERVPLMERLKFLSIYSSNLDEFYRVRMPALMALNSLARNKNDNAVTVLKQVNQLVHAQQEKFGKILTEGILPELVAHQISVIFNEPLPDAVKARAKAYFFEHVAGYISLTELIGTLDFFPENNKLYLLATVLTTDNNERHYIITIPSDHISRFYTVTSEGIQYIVFLDDIIRFNLPSIFNMFTCVSAYSFKITRDAELDLKDEYDGNLAKKIEKEITKRDLGLATRFLYQSGIPLSTLSLLAGQLGLQQATFVEGGTYHNLKDLSSLPLGNNRFAYETWPKTKYATDDALLFDVIRKREILLHPPYHSYETVVRFFNEAAIDTQVTRIYVTLYRVASDSRIASALIHAAKNGKKVTVFIELKARFDEANNIKWARKMKEAGVRIISSIPELKVHAKIALVKRTLDKRTEYMGLLSTGNFNESTARFYTDHVLLTANTALLKEAEQLFIFLKKRRKPKTSDNIRFNHLLVAQFNLQKQFVTLIDREIDFAKQGLPASITIKMNNLEDQVLIAKLYEASNAGVHISLIVRSICCLVPGVQGMSENIRVIRIVDRYLEHGRVFMFHNNGEPHVFLGSADWMNRNIYRRIEVCFPVYNPQMKTELIRILACQLSDTVQAVTVTEVLENKQVGQNPAGESVQSQKEISLLLAGS